MTLSRGRLVVVEGSLKGQAVDFMFNPTEYSVKKTNTWNFQSKKAGNVPTWEFGGGGPRELQLELLFDSTLPREGGSDRDMRRLTDRLFAFMMIDRTLAGPGTDSQLGRPPRCLLVWGRDTPFQFECYLADCSVKYSLFGGDGTPIRATATLSLKEVNDPTQLARQNPTSGGSPGWRSHPVRDGDRLDWIAHEYYGDPAEWKAIAEANHLEDPLNIRPGTVLTVPPLD